MTHPPDRATGATALLIGLLIAAASDAGVVETTDGTRLVGTITKVSPGSVVIDTRFAGTVTIARDAVTAMRTETPVTTKLVDGTVVTGTAAIDADGRWHVVNDTLEMRAAPEKVQAAWQPEATPPPEAGYEQPRTWAYTVGVDVNGREGNAQERGVTVTADATLAGEDDELYLYTSVNKVQRTRPTRSSPASPTRPGTRIPGAGTCAPRSSATCSRTWTCARRWPAASACAC